MEQLTPIEKAFIKNAKKRHTGDFGKSVVVVPKTGDTFVGQDAKEASKKCVFYYGFPAGYEVALTGKVGVTCIGFDVTFPSFNSALEYVDFQATQVRLARQHRLQRGLTGGFHLHKP